MIRDAGLQDAESIAAIYNYYVANTTITFEEEQVTSATMAERMTKVVQAELPWLVLEADNQVVGYAYASKWKERTAYRFAVETSVYLSQEHHGKGYGTLLYQALINRLASRGINAVIGGVTLPNPASEALHEKIGMQKVAHFHHVGYKFATWLDVGYWQLNLAE